MGGPSFTEDTIEGRMECWVGVRGEESTTDAGEMSECDGDGCRRRALYSGGTEVVSESRVTSDAALIFVLTGVDVLPEDRRLDGLADCVRGAS